MQQNRPAYILEITWLIVAVLALGITIHSLLTKGLRDSIFPFSITVLASGIYLLRRHFRKK
jgi:hypothetical protein